MHNLTILQVILIIYKNKMVLFELFSSNFYKEIKVYKMFNVQKYNTMYLLLAKKNICEFKTYFFFF